MREPTRRSPDDGLLLRSPSPWQFSSRASLRTAADARRPAYAGWACALRPEASPESASVMPKATPTARIKSGW